MDPNIQFTLEKEKDGSLPFLDVLLFRDIVQTLKGSRNGNPAQFIRRSQSVSTRQKSNVDYDVTPKTVNIPYIQGLSESIKRVLSKLDIVVRFYPMRTLRYLLVRPKDPIPPNLINEVIYKVPCKQCDKVYVGQAGRSLDCRLKEHKRAFKCGNVEASAIAGRMAIKLTGKQQVFWIHAKSVSQMSFGVMAYTQSAYHQQRTWCLTACLLLVIDMILFCVIQ